ncbi:HD domain-containing phosphohydrolase [Hydrogenovibrio sp. 3SP14C1]|uniref:HD family phosphohydrolase n=1 Tax=Hydrogenovibrio sp. 3SP14C1 TaxID=3038774 RepID=UPI002417F85F|nr:HD family phosphohydrolase [Hydrogenovibrio sp. 3SP14C1]MDG4813302.1 HD domain-containing phosphohydrolase [Hydrogenovibrio sp. 3SP14C1]
MTDSLLEKIEQLNQVGIALSAESDTPTLLQQILTSAQSLTHADGGTLYRVIDQQQLHFDVVQNTSLDIKLGGNHPDAISFPPIALTLATGEENLTTVASYVAIKGNMVNIEDIYSGQAFDFSGALAFDQQVHYRTKSMLTIPLKNFDQEVIGVLQLVNAMDEQGNVIAFSKESESLVRSLASQASIALTNRQLIDEHKQLFEAFSKMVADAIDKKSPYTGEHCQRVPVITMMLAKAASESNHPDFKTFQMDENDLFELETAAWLHDCGKLTTPEYIMDKSTKLETVFDRIELIKTRLNLKAFQSLAQQHNIPTKEIEASQKKYFEYSQRLQDINIGQVFFNESSADFLKSIQSELYRTLEGTEQPMLTADEFLNLNIPRGTLNDEERNIMQDHAAMSIHMLDILPFPKELQRVSEYAGGHHERMDGQGYPDQLTREELSIPARIMGIADIFEALSAGDRPYKKAKTLSESLRILGFMKQDGHIDPDLFNLFIRDKVYLTYAKAYLNPSQIDEVDHSQIPGYKAT